MLISQPITRIYFAFKMRFDTLYYLVATAAALPSQARQADDFKVQKWIPAGPGDSRGPCPMMNTLANHGYLYVKPKSLLKWSRTGAFKT